MPIRGKSVLWIALSFSLLPSIAYSQPPDLTYHTVTPCTVVDTRVAGGAFAGNETRTYNVVGSGSLASQGGSSTGCGIPGFSNGIPQAQAVALNFIAIGPSGPGHLVASASDQPLTASVLNYITGQAIANTAPVAVRQGAGTGDIKVLSGVSGTHLLISVVGYYSKAVQTVYVHPVPGDNTASGTRLINALAGITNASATKRYLIKVEPGIYDVGSTMLVMKPYVDIEGSGQQATVIQGVGNNDGSLQTAIVKGASSAELRDLQVKSVGSPSLPDAIALYIASADTRVTRVTLVASGGDSHWGIRNWQATPTIKDVSIDVQGGSIAYGIVNTGAAGDPPGGTRANLERTTISVASASTAYGIFQKAYSVLDARDVRITVTGGSTTYGFGVDPSFNTHISATFNDAKILVQGASSTSYGIQFGAISQLNVEQSQVRASAPSSYGIYSPGGLESVRVDHSEIAGATYTIVGYDPFIGATRLHGGSVNAAAATCAGVYDESFVFYASTCP